jgi:NADH-quinone oxidoreductase subunit A
MHFDYANVLVFASLAMLFVGGALLVGRLFRPNRPSLEKSRTYECGEIPTGSAWINMNPRFYLIALIFLIFDVEIAFIFPVATVFRRYLESGSGLLVLGEILVFVLILFAGLIFVWGRGDLEWIKSISNEDDPQTAEKIK